MSTWIFEIQRDKWSWAVTWSLLLITGQWQLFGSWLWVPVLGSPHTQHLVGSPQHPKVSPPNAGAGIQENQTPAESSITKSHTGGLTTPWSPWDQLRGRRDPTKLLGVFDGVGSPRMAPHKCSIDLAAYKVGHLDRLLLEPLRDPGKGQSTE